MWIYVVLYIVSKNAFKYITEGHDRVNVKTVVGGEASKETHVHHDEIGSSVANRYIGQTKAM